MSELRDFFNGQDSLMGFMQVGVLMVVLVFSMGAILAKREGRWRWLYGAIIASLLVLIYAPTLGILYKDAETYTPTSLSVKPPKYWYRGEQRCLTVEDFSSCSQQGQ